ncbi:MAG: hypothetical protein M0R80_02895 [Proteobacteria bacterium]|jgi:hypothetical protein|nr:hypothetical protein [Pseudomonadota bacterium]
MSEFNDDLDVEDVLKEKPKKIKSGAKGKAAERDICHILNKRFANILLAHPSWGTFSRSVGSGNRWGQGVMLSEQAKNVYASDICCPEHFLFVIESKKGYNEIDLCTCFSGKCPGLDTFLQQVLDDSLRVNRKPLLIWKKDRKPAIAFIREPMTWAGPNWPEEFQATADMFYTGVGGWSALPFTELLTSTPDTFWFST